MTDAPADVTGETLLHGLRHRSGTPVTDAFRRWLSTASPKETQDFADAVNGMAAGLLASPLALQDDRDEKGDDLATGVIDFATFKRVELRTGTVTAAEWVPKSDKLLKLEISFGALGSRTILAGIAKDYTVEGIVGQHVVAVYNLTPRKMMGLMSHGMLLAGASTDGKVILASCPGVPDGSLLG